MLGEICHHYKEKEKLKIPCGIFWNITMHSEKKYHGILVSEIRFFVRDIGERKQLVFATEPRKLKKEMLEKNPKKKKSLDIPLLRKSLLI